GPYMSTSATFAPRRVRCHAVHAPNTPAPITATSKVLFVVMLLELRAAILPHACGVRTIRAHRFTIEGRDLENVRGTTLQPRSNSIFPPTAAGSAKKACRWDRDAAVSRTQLRRKPPRSPCPAPRLYQSSARIAKNSSAREDLYLRSTGSA